jgi:hypothetical protein
MNINEPVSKRSIIKMDAWPFKSTELSVLQGLAVTKRIIGLGRISWLEGNHPSTSLGSNAKT